MGGEEKRHQMMQNLFGDQSEEEEEEEEEDVDSEHESNPQPIYASDEAEGELRREGEGEVEGEGNEEAESEGEMREAEGEADPGESEGEREASSVEVDAVEQREESDEKEEYGHRGAGGGRRRDVVESGSEELQFQDVEDDDEVDQEAGSPRSPEGKGQTQFEQSAPEIRDVFGDSDEEEDDGYAARNNVQHADVRSPLEEDEGYGKDLRPEDVLADEDGQIQSEEEENFEVRHKEKPVGPPLEIEIPFRPPPADPTKMNMIKVSNIMGIDPTPFDPKTYVEEKTFVTDESGTQKRLRLENNIVRWRTVKNKDGTTSVESNARFVRWSDGSLQLLIGNEVLDISVQDAHQDQTHLFMRHNKSLLQSQGRILRKMRFMPSSLTSNSHRLLTQLVDSRHRKVYKVKNCVTDIDPEREKEEKEKAESQNIRASELLNRKKEKVSRKYTQSVDRRHQLSPGFLEDALDEDDEQDYYDPRRTRRRFEEDMEVEARAEKRIMNAKKGHKDLQHKPVLPAAKASKHSLNYSESDREESEYETDGEEDERSPPRKKAEEPEHEYEEDEEEEQYEEEPEVDAPSDEEDESEEPKQRGKEFGGGRKLTGIESDEDSPPRKMPTHRRMAVVYDSDDE